MQLTTSTPTNKRKEQGLTAIELVIVLGIFALVVALVFSLRGQAMGIFGGVSNTTAAAQVMQAVTSTRTGGSYTNIDEDVVARTEKVPETLLDDGGNLVTPEGAAITVAAQSWAGGANNVAEITWPLAPRETCNDVARRVAETAKHIEVNGTLLKDPSQDKALNTAEVTDACDNPQNTIVWYQR